LINSFLDMASTLQQHTKRNDLHKSTKDTFNSTNNLSKDTITPISESCKSTSFNKKLFDFIFIHPF
jgi:hypothetical protein